MVPEDEAGLLSCPRSWHNPLPCNQMFWARVKGGYRWMHWTYKTEEWQKLSFD